MNLTSDSRVRHAFDQAVARMHRASNRYVPACRAGETSRRIDRPHICAGNGAAACCVAFRFTRWGQDHFHCHWSGNIGDFSVSTRIVSVSAKARVRASLPHKIMTADEDFEGFGRRRNLVYCLFSRSSQHAPSLKSFAEPVRVT